MDREATAEPPRVTLRLGGTRDGAMQLEVFSAGTDPQNLARTDGFKKMVDAAEYPPRPGKPTTSPDR